MYVSIHARLALDPKEIKTKTGTPMTVCSAAVNLPIANQDDTITIWYSVCAFNRQAEELAKLKKGALVSLAGRVQGNRYTNKDGEEVEQMQIVVDAIVSAYSARPGGGRKKSAPAKKPDFNDPLNF